MRPRPRCRENQRPVIYSINQQPIRFDVTFPKANKIACERMITMTFFQRFFLLQCFQNSIQSFNVCPTFSQALQIFAEL